MNRRIIFEDDDVRVIFRDGKSDFLMVTFGDLITKVDGLRFFADVPADKLDISVLGIVPKRAHWYPAATMRAVAHATRDVRRRFDRVLAYGGSMGGYGAIKFSALLRADVVVALCPQWSIDAKECDGINPGWQRQYLPEMAGMGIRPGDVAGRVFLFADLHDAVDRFHSGRIGQVVKELRRINFPSVGHHVTSVMAGTANLEQVIAGCWQDDVVSLRRLVRQSRRYHLDRVTNVMKRAVRRHAGLAHAGVRAFVNGPDFADRVMTADLLDVMMSCCHRFHDRDSEAVILSRRMEQESNPAMQAAFALRRAGLTGGQVGLRTAHGTGLFYDLRTGTVRHGALSAPPDHSLPLQYEVTGNAIALRATGAGLSIALSANPAARIPAMVNATGGGGAGEMVAKAPGRFAIRFDDQYLSAQADGTLIADRQEARNWEMFSFV